MKTIEIILVSIGAGTVAGLIIWLAFQLINCCIKCSEYADFLENKAPNHSHILKELQVRVYKLEKWEQSRTEAETEARKKKK